MDELTITKLKKIPRTILGVTSLRRNPQKVFSLARRKGLPILVTEFNKPQGVILPLEIFDEVVNILNFMELQEALDSVEVYRREKNQGILKELKSLANLVRNKD